MANKSPNERMANRNTKRQVSHSSHSLLEQRLCNWEFSKICFIQWCTATTAHIRPSRIWFFRKQGGKPDCRTIVYRWYYTGKCTWCTTYTICTRDTPSQHVRTLESQPRSIVINFTCKDTITPGLVDCQFKMLNFELYTYFVVLEPVYSKFGTAVQKFQQNMPIF